MGKKISKRDTEKVGAAIHHSPPFFEHILSSKLLFLTRLAGFITFFSTLVLITILSLVRKANPDIWFHLKTGEIILQNMRIPITDIFSFTVFGRQWITHEWLSQVVLALIHVMFGEVGLSFYRTLFTLLPISVVGFLCIRRSGFGIISLVCLSGLFFLFGLSSWDTFVARPHLLAWICLSLWVFLLYEIKSGQKRAIGFLIPIQFLWANMHGSAVLGPFLLAALLPDSFISKKMAKRPQESQLIAPNVLGRYILLCIALCFITPNTWHMVFQSLPFIGKTAFTHINEWKSPFHSTYTGFFFVPFFITWIALIFASTLLNWKSISIFEKLLLLPFVYLSLKNQRNISLSFIAVVPVIHFNLVSIFKNARIVLLRYKSKFFVNTDKAILLFNVFVSIIILATSLTISANIVRNGIAKSNSDIVNRVSLKVDQAPPIAVADFIDTNNLPGPIRNSYEFGGYFIWRLYPKYKVFFDGRADVYGEELFERFFIITPQHFYEDLIKYGINTVAMKMTNVQWVHNFLLARGIYAPAKKHSLVFFDDFSCIYVKDEAAPKIVNEFGFQYLHPVLGWQKPITAENFAEARMECERAINSSEYHSLASKYLEQLNTIARSVSNEQMAKKIVE